MTTFQFKTEEEKNLASAEITWAIAQPLIADYATRTDALKVQQPDGTIDTLKAYRFSATQIQNLLNQPHVTDLYLMFATSPKDAANITIIAGGVNDEDLNGGVLLTNLLYDYCDPCPNKCAAM